VLLACLSTSIGLCYEPHIGYLFSGFNALLEEKNEK
ncbi:MAG: pyridoxamine kinase, partial [Streptococcus salivarius]|nr:pyridoxamine kinase [Streptococcus salivarius]